MSFFDKLKETFDEVSFKAVLAGSDLAIKATQKLNQKLEENPELAQKVGEIIQKLNIQPPKF